MNQRELSPFRRFAKVISRRSRVWPLWQLTFATERGTRMNDFMNIVVALVAVDRDTHSTA